MRDRRTAQILVVDDEPLIADTLTLIFQRSGYTAQSAYNGEEALRTVGELPPGRAHNGCGDARHEWHQTCRRYLPYAAQVPDTVAFWRCFRLFSVAL